MSVVKEGFLFLEKKSLLTKVWKCHWFVLFKKKSTDSPEIYEYILFFKNNVKNLNDDYMVTCVDIKTLTGIKYISKKDRNIIQLQYSYKNNTNNQIIHLSIDNGYSLTEWLYEISRAKDYMRENTLLDGELISRIQESPLYKKVNPRYDRLDLFNFSAASSVTYENKIRENIYYIGIMQHPPKYFPFEHGDNVIMTIENDNICLKPAILTIGGIDRTFVSWPLVSCSRFGSTKDCFFVEVDLVESSRTTSSHQSNSQIFCIKSHTSRKIIKDVLNYCKNKKESHLSTSLIEPQNANNFDTPISRPQRRKSFFQCNSIYNYDKNEQNINAKSILKNPKRFFTIRRTKNI